MDTTSILIVEDDPIIGADLFDRLTEAGYIVLGPVAAGEEALPFFSQNSPPDLVLMDIQLEGEWDGIETTRRIRQQYDLPVIFLTSNSDDNTFRQASAVNPSAFLSKPFRGRDLKHAIELAIRQSARQVKTAESGQADDNAFLFSDRLFIKVKDRMQRLFFKDILWVEADDYYCKVHVEEKDFLVTKTLKKLADDLSGRPEFMRVHRSYLVNLQHVEGIGELYLHIGKNKIPFSKDKKDQLLSNLNKI